MNRNKRKLLSEGKEFQYKTGKIEIKNNILIRAKAIIVNINVKKLGIQFAFAALLFLSCFMDFSGDAYLKFVLHHYDEFLTCIMLLYILLNCNQIFKEKHTLVIVWIIFLFLGLISTILYHYQPIIAEAIDSIIITSRFVIGYCATSIYIKKHHLENLSYYVNGLARAITVILFILSIHDIFLNPFFPRGDYRYFTYSLRLMFSHPTYLCAASTTLLIVLCYGNKFKNNLKYMMMISFVGCMTLRGKAIGFILMFWILYTIFFSFKRKHYFFIIVSSTIAIIVSCVQFITYFVTSKYSPRLILLKDSIKLALNHFPFGTGFASFGSTIAAQYYSPLYVQLGYMNNWGMSQNNRAFLTDSFWPCIIGQFGFLGVIVFVYVIVYFIRASFSKMKQDKTSGFCMLMIMAYMIITSMAETSFFNPTSLLMFILFAAIEHEPELDLKIGGQL